MASGEIVARGSCNCGGVKYTVTGPLREVIACHCGQCRKQSGHFYAATNVADSDLHIEDSGSLKWYAASEDAHRGFCGDCGSALFWKRVDRDKTSVLAGTMDGDAGGIKLDRHIFVA
ncbi:MAG: GFA family protein, partial [Rhizobiaceae bacterium]|nr:GFA family protein [Hyphomicrobiales bacterium]NRB32974.1 GFA family protein [Rhizobiaceae bacterium]